MANHGHPHIGSPVFLSLCISFVFFVREQVDGSGNDFGAPGCLCGLDDC